MTEASKRKIEALKHCSAEDSWCHDCPAAVECINAETTTSHKVAKMALGVIAELACDLKEREDLLDSTFHTIMELLEAGPKWTPVTEGLPEPFVTVLVTHKQGRPCS